MHPWTGPAMTASSWRGSVGMDVPFEVTRACLGSRATYHAAGTEPPRDHQLVQWLLSVPVVVVPSVPFAVNSRYRFQTHSHSGCSATPRRPRFYACPRTASGPGPGTRRAFTDVRRAFTTHSTCSFPHWRRRDDEKQRITSHTGKMNTALCCIYPRLPLDRIRPH
jgi:hypothetical protein